MRRISLIDRWHRPRGTVDAEFEVMKIAADITRDLRRLWDERPPLMDHAVQGRLTALHLGKKLAATVTKSCRVYVAGYYASFIHLHRVAYVQFPCTDEVLNAIDVILSMARLIIADSGTLPVSMLWPLLMCGSEISSREDRVWIVAQLRKFDNATTNGRMTADVLEQVQERQERLKRREDIRTVMLDVFNSSFAII
ncbi:uncharacterized protein V1510DRAFT_414860 [Dipodascopsis tothii]|uniref:uncharacterized protein n=1 Tax=Dipodascopsis tothii TaxID=44089 RepID=UPI0034CDEF02